MRTLRGAILASTLSLCCFGALASEYDVAAYVWPAYQPEPRWAELGIFGDGIGEWQNVKEAVPKWDGHRQPLVPLWGYENEADPKVVEKKIDVAVSHGVNVFIYDWYWYGGRSFLEDALDKGFLGAPNNGKMKFFVMWANHHVDWLWDNKAADKRRGSPRWRGWVGADEFRKISDRWIVKYFSRPNYYRIGGKPVLMIYEVGTFIEGLGGAEKAAAALADFRERCEKAGLGGVHVMACDYRLSREMVKALGIDSATIYNMVHWSNPKGNPIYSVWAEKGARRFDAARKVLGVPAYFAHASVGWDTNPRYPPSSVQPTVLGSTPEKFEAALRRAKDWCDRNTPDGMPKLITVNSWNEWTEGSYLEPDTHFKFGYLEAVKRVFAHPSSGRDAAVSDDVPKQATARDFQGEIDAAHKSGGGRVTVPGGVWDVGPIHLRSNVELHLEEGSTLRFSADASKYLPKVRTSWQGEEMENLSPLVYAAFATNVSITGKGTLTTDNEAWDRWHKAKVGNRRPQFVQFFCCGNVRLEGFSVRGSPFWTIHLYRTDDAVVKGLDVSAFDERGFALKNTDGIDVECSRRVRVEDCTFRQGDDAIVLKSGRDEDGIRRGIPTEDVFIKNCRVREGHVLLGIGSEVGGGIRNVTMRDCTVEGAVDRLMFVKTNAKRGGFIENIAMERVRAGKVRDAVVALMADYWYCPPPGATNLHRTAIRGVAVRDVSVDDAGRVIALRGDPELPAQDFEVCNVTVGNVRNKVVESENVVNLKMEGLVVRRSPSVQFRKDDPSREGQEK